MTWREELEAHALARFRSPEIWPPKLEISDRDFNRMMEAGEIPEKFGDVFRNVLTGAHANAFVAARKENLTRTKKQWLEKISDAKSKLRSFIQVLTSDEFILMELLNDPCSTSPAARHADSETRRSLRVEAGRDIDGFFRIADRLETMIEDIEALPDREGSNNSAPYVGHLIRALEMFWRHTLHREIDATQKCRFRLLMDAVFRYTNGGSVSSDALSKRLKTHLRGK